MSGSELKSNWPLRLCSLAISLSASSARNMTADPDILASHCRGMAVRKRGTVRPSQHTGTPTSLGQESWADKPSAPGPRKPRRQNTAWARKAGRANPLHLGLGSPEDKTQPVRTCGTMPKLWKLWKLWKPMRLWELWRLWRLWKLWVRRFQTETARHRKNVSKH